MMDLLDQILDKEKNIKYYEIIESFYKITGIPAVLNTSLNLHGYPISSTLENVIYTFKNSGLKYLYINDEFLIKKKCLRKFQQFSQLMIEENFTYYF